MYNRLAFSILTDRRLTPIRSRAPYQQKNQPVVAGKWSSCPRFKWSSVIVHLYLRAALRDTAVRRSWHD